MNPKTAYTYISEHRRDLWEVENVQEWVQQAQNAQSTIPEQPNMRYVDFGELSAPVSEGTWDVIRTVVQGDVVKQFKDVLLQLWLNGVNLHWGKLYPEGTFKKVALPGYAFDRKKFWL
jgi:acyl transferase domain-containing protein